MSNEAVEVVSEDAVDPFSATTRKTAGCAVSLGEAILREIIGKDIANIPTENANQLMSTIINNELKMS